MQKKIKYIESAQCQKGDAHTHTHADKPSACVCVYVYKKRPIYSGQDGNTHTVGHKKFFSI